MIENIVPQEFERLPPREIDRTVHAMQRGRAVCGLGGPPSRWPDGDVWSSLDEWNGLAPGFARCMACDDFVRLLDGESRWSPYPDPPELATDHELVAEAERNGGVLIRYPANLRDVMEENL